MRSLQPTDKCSKAETIKLQGLLDSILQPTDILSKADTVVVTLSNGILLQPTDKFSKSETLNRQNRRIFQPNLYQAHFNVFKHTICSVLSNYALKRIIYSRPRTEYYVRLNLTECCNTLAIRGITCTSRLKGGKSP